MADNTPIRKNSGYLYKNTEKKNERQPDYRGKLTDQNGKEWWVSGWNKSNEKSGPFISIAITDPDEQHKISAMKSNNNTSTQYKENISNLSNKESEIPNEHKLKSLDSDFGDLFEGLT